MSLLALYAFIKFWLPLATATGFCVKGFFYIRSVVKNTQEGISTWANSLLDNHMTHIQVAAEEATECLKVMSATNQQLATIMQTMREDFQQAQTENIRTQSAILTGIEVLRDR